MRRALSPCAQVAAVTLGLCAAPSSLSNEAADVQSPRDWFDFSHDKTSPGPFLQDLSVLLWLLRLKNNYWKRWVAFRKTWCNTVLEQMLKRCLMFDLQWKFLRRSGVLAVYMSQSSVRCFVHLLKSLLKTGFVFCQLPAVFKVLTSFSRLDLTGA